MKSLSNLFFHTPIGSTYPALFLSNSGGRQVGRLRSTGRAINRSFAGLLLLRLQRLSRRSQLYGRRFAINGSLLLRTQRSERLTPTDRKHESWLQGYMAAGLKKARPTLPLYEARCGSPPSII
jgi:hypothetical protein